MACVSAVTVKDLASARERDVRDAATTCLPDGSSQARKVGHKLGGLAVRKSPRTIVQSDDVHSCVTRELSREVRPSVKSLDFVTLSSATPEPPKKCSKIQNKI